MSQKAEKKIRQLLRRTQNEIVEGAQQALPAVAMQTVLAMRKWSFRDRFKFARWLLVGQGPWGGV